MAAKRMIKKCINYQTLKLLKCYLECTNVSFYYQHAMMSPGLSFDHDKHPKSTALPVRDHLVSDTQV